jgi:hypothetical protein
MKTATLSISKSITLIDGSSVFCSKMSSFESIINNYNLIRFTGMSTPSKFNKYENLLLNNGFVLCQTFWNQNAGFEGKNSNVMNFSISYIKN